MSSKGNAMSLPHMTNLKEVHTDHLAQDVASWENEGGAPSQMSDEATSWFIPPLVIPAFLVVLIVARIAYVAYL
jgi:hypothetical protein